MSNIIIFGAGAHARRIGYLARGCGWQIQAFVDENHKRTATLLDAPILSAIPHDAEHVFIAVGDGAIRSRLHKMAVEQGICLPILIHHTAYVSPDVKLGQGTVILAGAVIESGTSVGEGVIIDIGALIDHDGQIGNYCHIKPGAIVKSYSRMEDYSIVS